MNTKKAGVFILWFIICQCFVVVPFFVFGISPLWLSVILCLGCMAFNIAVPFLNLILELFLMIYAFVIQFNTFGFINWFTWFFMAFPFFFVINAYITFKSFWDKK